MNIIKKVFFIVSKIMHVRAIKELLINFYYKIIFKTFGEKSWIFGKIKVYNPGNIYLGHNSFLNEGVTLCASNKIIIGNNCNISSYSKLYTVGLDLNEKDYKIRGHITDKIIINDGVWIGIGSIILKGIEIGEGSVIAAGSVVTKNIPKFEMWGGVPAKKIKTIDKI